MLGITGKLKKKLNEIKPNIIHSLGVFPDYAICRMKNFNQVMTLRNFVWDDYPKRVGVVNGTIASIMQLYAAKKVTKTVVCSKSLSEIYSKKLKLNFDYVQNGVDIEKYAPCDGNEKIEIRKALQLPEAAVIFVYAAPIVKRKNQILLIKAVKELENTYSNICLLLLGDGEDYDQVYNMCKDEKNIVMCGNVMNIMDYYKASDVYISSSKSEGLPNSVLEAMASGLPVVLSDIPQHKEIYNLNHEVGYLFESDNIDDLKQKIVDAISSLSEEKAAISRKTVIENLSAEKTSKAYQNIYELIIDDSDM
jgi:glycosyltransferase involved in cell wall biosynthesis